MRTVCTHIILKETLALILSCLNLECIAFSASDPITYDEFLDFVDQDLTCTIYI